MLPWPTRGVRRPSVRCPLNTYFERHISVT